MRKLLLVCLVAACDHPTAPPPHKDCWLVKSIDMSVAVATISVHNSDCTKLNLDSLAREGWKVQP